MKHLYLFIFLNFLLFISGCKTTKNVVKEVEKVEISDLYLAYSENVLEFDIIEFTSNVNYSSANQSLGFTGIFRMKKDEKIWASFKKFGFEAGRILITPDSIFILNRLQKVAMLDDISKLKSMSGIPLEFGDLQQLLLGGSFWPESLEEVNDSTLVKMETIKNEVIEVKHIFDEVNLVRKSGLKSKDQGAATVYYNDYKTINNTSLAFDREILVKSEGKDVILNLQTVNFDHQSTKSFPFEIPSNYSRQSL